MTTDQEEKPKSPDLKVVADDSKQPAEVDSDTGVEGSALQQEEPAQAPLTLEEQLTAKETELLRVQADFQNFRIRVAREKDDLRKYSTTSFARDLLPVLDAFDQCLKTEGLKAEEEVKDKEGLNLIATQFKSTLQKHGIEQIGVVGEVFDPQWHQAIRKEESSDAEEDTILEVYAPGFKIHGRVLRPAMVAVTVAT